MQVSNAIERFPDVLNTLLIATTLPTGNVQTYKNIKALQQAKPQLISDLPNDISKYLLKKNIQAWVVPMTVVHQGNQDNSPIQTETVEAIVTNLLGSGNQILLPNRIRTQAISTKNVRYYYDAQNNICILHNEAHNLEMKVPATLKSQLQNILPSSASIHSYNELQQDIATSQQEIQQKNSQNTNNQFLNNDQFGGNGVQNVQQQNNLNNYNGYNPNQIYNQNFQSNQLPQPFLNQNFQQNYQNQFNIPNQNLNTNQNLNNFNSNNFFGNQNAIINQQLQTQNNVNNNQNFINPIYNQKNQIPNNNLNNIINPINQNLNMFINNNMQFPQQQQQMQAQLQQQIQLEQQLNREVPECIIQQENNGWKTMWDNKFYPTMINATDEKGNNSCVCQIAFDANNKPLTTDTIPPQILYTITSQIASSKDKTNWTDQDINGQLRLHTLKKTEDRTWHYSNTSYNEEGKRLLPNTAENICDIKDEDVADQPVQVLNNVTNECTIMTDDNNLNYADFLSKEGRIKSVENKDPAEQIKQNNRNLYLNLNRQLRELSSKITKNSFQTTNIESTRKITEQIEEISNILHRQYYRKPPITGQLPGDLQTNDPKYRNINKSNQFWHDHIEFDGINGYIPGYFEDGGQYIEGKFRFYIPMIGDFIEFTESELNDFSEKQQKLVGNANCNWSCFFNASNVFLQENHLLTMCFLKISDELFEKDAPIQQNSTKIQPHCTIKNKYKHLLNQNPTPAILAFADYIRAVYRGNFDFVEAMFLRTTLGQHNTQFAMSEANDAKDSLRTMLQTFHKETSTENFYKAPQNTYSQRLLAAMPRPFRKSVGSSFVSRSSYTTGITKSKYLEQNDYTFNIQQGDIAELSVCQYPDYPNATTLAHPSNGCPPYMYILHSASNTLCSGKEINEQLGIKNFQPNTNTLMIAFNRGKNNKDKRTVYMPLYVENNGNYFELCSIVQWLPGGVNHFVNYKKHSDGKWYCYNDSQVFQVSEEDILTSLAGQQNNYVHLYTRVPPGRWQEKMNEQDQALLTEDMRKKITLTSKEADDLRKIIKKNFNKQQDTRNVVVTIKDQPYTLSELVGNDWTKIYQKLNNVYTLSGTNVGREQNGYNQAMSPLFDINKLTLQSPQVIPQTNGTRAINQDALPNIGLAWQFRKKFGTFVSKTPPYAIKIYSDGTPYRQYFSIPSNYEQCKEAIKQAIRTNNPEIPVTLTPDKPEGWHSEEDAKKEQNTCTIGALVTDFSPPYTENTKKLAMTTIRMWYNNIKQRENALNMPQTTLNDTLQCLSNKLADLGVAQKQPDQSITINAIPIPEAVQKDIDDANKKKEYIPESQPLPPFQQQPIVQNNNHQQQKTDENEEDTNENDDIMTQNLQKQINNSINTNQQTSLDDDIQQQDDDHEEQEENNINTNTNQQLTFKQPTNNNAFNQHGNVPTNTNSTHKTNAINTSKPATTGQRYISQHTPNTQSYRLPQNSFFQSPNTTTYTKLQADTQRTQQMQPQSLTSFESQFPTLQTITTKQMTTNTNTSSHNTNNNLPQNTKSRGNTNNSQQQTHGNNTSTNATPLEEPSYVGDIAIGMGLGGGAVTLGVLGETGVIPMNKTIDIALITLGIIAAIAVIIHSIYKKNQYEEAKQIKNNELHNLTTTNKTNSQTPPR